MKPDAWINQVADELHLAFRCDLVADDSEPLYRASTVEQEIEQLRERYGELEAAAQTTAEIISGCVGDFPAASHQLANARSGLEAALRDLQEGRA